MKKILITGEAGFIGSEIVEQFYNMNIFKIKVIDELY